jgi:hypothetical protein
MQTRSDQTLARDLQELVAALDRRVPRVEREGERAIASHAQRLRRSALKRICELERSLLADGRGVLVPWRDSGAIAREVVELRRDHPRYTTMCARAAAHGREMTWPAVARQYVAGAAAPSKRKRLPVVRLVGLRSTFGTSVP